MCSDDSDRTVRAKYAGADERERQTEEERVRKKG